MCFPSCREAGLVIPRNNVKRDISCVSASDSTKKCGLWDGYQLPSRRNDLSHRHSANVLIVSGREWGERNAGVAGLPVGRIAEAFKIVNTD